MSGPALRWEPSPAMAACWNGHAGSRRVALVDAHPESEAVRWNLWVADPDHKRIPAYGHEATPEAARAAAEAAWERWCATAGLVPAADLDALRAERDRLLRHVEAIVGIGLRVAAPGADPPDPDAIRRALDGVLARYGLGPAAGACGKAAPPATEDST